MRLFFIGLAALSSWMFGGRPVVPQVEAVAEIRTAQLQALAEVEYWSDVADQNFWGSVRCDRGHVHQCAWNLAVLYGLRVNGVCRTPARNAAVNGAPGSLHLKCQAADLSGSRARMAAGATWARAHGADEVLIHDAGSGVHLHVGWE